MSKASKFAGIGAAIGALALASPGMAIGLLGGPFAEFTMPMGLAFGAACGAVLGGIGGAAIGSLVKDDVPPFTAPELTKVGRSANLSVEPSLSQPEPLVKRRRQPVGLYQFDELIHLRRPS